MLIGVKMPNGVRSKRRIRLRCELCDILIGEEFIHKETYTLKVYRRDRKLCKTCYDELLAMIEPERSMYFKKHKID